MKPHDEKLILSLIKDDLINTKLVNGLNDLGLLAGDYYLHLSETILTLMGFSEAQRSDALYNAYMHKMEAVKIVSVEEGHAGMEVLAREVYGWLRTMIEEQ